MFEFGRDLRKLFEKARESDDLGWLELIGADLIEAEARRETTDAGRVSCARPFEAWMRASHLWRDHARRTGAAASLAKAASCASDATRHARTTDQTAAAGLEAAEIHLARFDLFGGPERLIAATSDVQALNPDRTRTHAWAVALSARLAARRSEVSPSQETATAALALCDAGRREQRHLPPTVADELTLDWAGLGLRVGIENRDIVLLDRVGQELRALVEASAPEQRPITRARALTLAAVGLKALAGLAGDTTAEAQGQALFNAAVDQFTPDHSPLDWVAVQLAQGPTQTPLLILAQAEAMTREPGLILGAMARERRLSAEASLAEAMGDVKAIQGLEAMVHRRLAAPVSRPPLDWAADQIGMAHLMLARARLIGTTAGAVGMMLAEAATTAREWGATALAERAEQVSIRMARA
ncbi:hypothetical protein [Brevundimonas sp.]|uniref:hypothetical protein n=1 Tax=Brevundimonas sp. TaxID=1871086 RepID=UPI0035AE2C76